MRIKKKQIILTVPILFFVFFPLFIEESSREVFNQTFIENTEFPFFCGIQLEKGRFQTDNLAEHCQDDSLETASLEAILLKSSVKDDLGVAFLKLTIDEKERYFIFALNHDNFLANREIEKDIYDLKIEEGKIVLNDSIYRIIDGRLEEIVEEKKELVFPGGQFSLRIPENWEVKRNEKEYHFYHREAEPSAVLLSSSLDFELINDEYRREFEEIKKSFTPFEIKNMADYRFFTDDLDHYLEVNTVNGKINYFENGVNKESFNILASGDPNNWNATPSGMYQILSKEGLRFSTESSVYMPFSMRIYGKYLIHGEAYFPSGVPYVSEVSGGCVRVRNEEMVHLYEKVEPELPVVVISHENEKFTPYQDNFEPFDSNFESLLVVDIDSGHVLFGKKAKEKRVANAINSIMTSMVAVENMGSTRRITVRKYMLGADRFNLIVPGRSFRLIDLISPALIENSDPAIRILSHYLGRDNTLSLMNEKAASIGMKDTEIFFFPETGYKSISTASDLYYLAYYLKNSRKPLLDISRGVWVPNINYGVFPGLQNKNIFYGLDNFSGGQVDSGEDGYSGFFIFDLEINQEERKVAITFSGAENRDEVRREIINIKEWLERAFK